MTLEEAIKQTGNLPKSFVLENGRRFETHFGVMADGEHMAMIWEMKGTERHHLYTIQYGKTKEEATEKLKQSIVQMRVL